VGDFNLIRSPQDRNRDGGNVNEMLLFNEEISNLGLVDIPLKGRKYTLSNMQDSPLLQRLDWFFTSVAWSTTFPNTMALPLAMTTSDHVPCVISIQTSIPKSVIFRFENRWLQHPDFLTTVENTWNQSIHYADAAKRITAKFKILRKELKKWSTSISSINQDIQDLNSLISLMDAIENFRDLLPMERTFRQAMKMHLAGLLKQQLAYWKQRGKIKWVTLGDENSRFFHAMASNQKRKNHIASLSNNNGDTENILLKPIFCLNPIRKDWDRQNRLLDYLILSHCYTDIQIWISWRNLLHTKKLMILWLLFHTISLLAQMVSMLNFCRNVGP
jgi:hypothetical protein